MVALSAVGNPAKTAPAVSFNHPQERTTNDTFT